MRGGDFHAANEQGGKYIFGISLIREDGSVQFPMQAVTEYRIAEENYCDAISAVQQAMNGYDLDIISYCWDDSNSRIQLEPRGNRGYIEFKAVKQK